MADAPILDVSSLRVAFPSYGRAPVAALRGIDLRIDAGEMVGLVGESGSGKTTLARAVMGLVPPPGRVEQGSVRFAGQDMATLSPEARRGIIGRELTMVIANPRAELNPVQTVGRQISNVVFHHLGVARRDADRQALDMLRAVRIPDPERRFGAYPHELSGGMAQRVVIAMALACGPRLVISDDATSGLDVTLQTQVLELLLGMVRDKGAAALFISRDIAIVAHFCARTAVIYHGELVEVAETPRFFARPRHPYSIMLLAAFSHNPALRARWTRTDALREEVAAAGCAFAPRCVRRQPRCAAEHPPLVAAGDGHQVRCHFPVEAAA